MGQLERLCCLLAVLALVPLLESKDVEHDSDSLPVHSDWDGASNSRQFQTTSHYAEEAPQQTSYQEGSVVETAADQLASLDDIPTDEAIQVLDFQLSTQDVDLQSDGRVMFTLSFQCPIGIYDPAGSLLVYPSQAVLQSPSGQAQSVMFMPSQHLVDGNVFQGVMKSELQLSRWNTEEGVYQVAYIMLVNSKGQAFYLDNTQLQTVQFPSELTVRNAKQDHQVPRLCNILWAQSSWQYTGTSDLAATWVTPTVDIDLFVDEHGSGLANRSDDHVLASYLVLQSLEAPSLQRITTFFSQGNWSYTSAPCSRYRLSIKMPLWAWAGQWAIQELYLADEAGNTVLWSGEQLNSLQLNHPVYIGNKNLTFHGDDVFDYHDSKYLEWLERVENGQEEAEGHEE
eukprot:m.155605 g.155605  ORF g.155605 m.155605 type:complete len:398 (+) comp16422_c0_seq3:1311-2504(+)